MVFESWNRAYIQKMELAHQILTTYRIPPSPVLSTPSVSVFLTRTLLLEYGAKCSFSLRSHHGMPSSCLLWLVRWPLINTALYWKEYMTLLTSRSLAPLAANVQSSFTDLIVNWTIKWECFKENSLCPIEMSFR